MQLEGKQKRRRKAERTKKTSRDSSKTIGAETDNAITPSVAEEVRNTPLVGGNRARSNEESRKNKCSNGMATAEDKVSTI